MIRNDGGQLKPALSLPNKKIRHEKIIYNFSVFSQSKSFSQEIILFKKRNTEVVLPNAKWFKSDSFKTLKDKIDTEIYLFRRKPIVDSKGVKVIPSIGIIFIAFRKPIKVNDYMFMEEAMRGTAAIYDTIYYVFTNKTSNFLKLTTANGKKAGYHDYCGSYIIYRIYITHGKICIQVICDATEEVFEKIKDEFEKFISSIKLKS